MVLKKIIKFLWLTITPIAVMCAVLALNSSKESARHISSALECIDLTAIGDDRELFNKELFKSMMDDMGFNSYYSNHIYDIDNIDTLFVVVEKDSPGLFEFNHNLYGFYNEILTKYAKEKNKQIKYIVSGSHRYTATMLRRPEVAFAVVVSHNSNDEIQQHYLSTSLRDSSKYVVLGNKRNRHLNKKSLEYILDSTKVIYRRGATAIPELSSRALNYLQDTLSARFLETRDYMNMVRNNKYNFIVCRADEAFLYMFNHGELVRTHVLADRVKSELVVHWRNKSLYKDFEGWMAEFRPTKEYENIQSYYHQYLYQQNFMRDGYINPIGAISHYDNLFIKAAEGTPYDWRLLAAIACVESKFNPMLVSHKGAIGIMQVMPSNTKRWDITKEQLFDEKTNIECAVRLMEENRRMLKSYDDMTQDDIAILLATYNAGYGHVSDAIRLAKHYNEDYTSWEVIKKQLYNKRKRVYFSQRKYVKSGSFISNETERYVTKVMKMYNEYINDKIEK